MRLGAGFRTAAGGRRLVVDLPQDATVDHLLARLGELEPALDRGLDAALPVVRGTQVDRARRLEDGDEVALLTPVAGGARSDPRGPIPERTA